MTARIGLFGDSVDAWIQIALCLGFRFVLVVLLTTLCLGFRFGSISASTESSFLNFQNQALDNVFRN